MKSKRYDKYVMHACLHANTRTDIIRWRLLMFITQGCVIQTIWTFIACLEEW